MLVFSKLNVHDEPPVKLLALLNPLSDTDIKLLSGIMAIKQFERFGSNENCAAPVASY